MKLPEIFVRNWEIKLLSLGLALFAWYYVSGGR